MRSLLLVLIVWLVCGVGMAMGAGMGRRDAPAPQMLADFEEPDVLDRIVTTKSVSVSLSDQDVVSGQRCLEVRVPPFSKHGDRWPYVFLIDEYFPAPIDLSRHSRVLASVRNVTEGFAKVQFTLSSKPYNDGGRNLEGEYFVIPGGATMQCALPTSLFSRPMNDPSSVQALMFVFPPNETDAIYRIDAVQAVYDPAVGSPAERLSAELAAETRSLQAQIRGLDKTVDWRAVPAERAADLRGRIPELAAAVRNLQQRARVAVREGWKGEYNAQREAVEVLAQSLGEFAVADKTGFHLWQRPRYTYARRNALPTLASPALEHLELKMARNEFRDVSWMVTACDRDVTLEVSVAGADKRLADAVRLRWSDFVSPAGLSEYADPLVPLDGPLTIPRGESRELWATFDTRWHNTRPGRHEFRLQMRDLASGQTRAVPVRLTVWSFPLPSYDVLPNNAYVEFHNSQVGQQVPDEGVRHMKMYGVNMTYVLPQELPLPVKVDAQNRLIEFSPAGFSRRVSQMLAAWQAAPGQERLQWVFSLSGAPQHMLEDKSIPFLSDQWNHVFAQWLTRFRDLLKTLGVADEDWMLVLADESTESVLTTYEIPFAEMIKRLDPQIKITCNSSEVIHDPATAERFFRAFDILQPCLDSLKQSPDLRQWVGVGRRPLWTYRCQSMAGLKKNLYDYYRVYAWENLDYGITGTGIWTYCAQDDGAWSATGRCLNYNLVFKARDKAEVLHSRRYEFYREGNDDYRYVWALREISRVRGAKAERESRDLINQAIADITANVDDTTRCERWRLRIAERIEKLRAGG